MPVGLRLSHKIKMTTIEMLLKGRLFVLFIITGTGIFILNRALKEIRPKLQEVSARKAYGRVAGDAECRSLEVGCVREMTSYQGFMLNANGTSKTLVDRYVATLVYRLDPHVRTETSVRLMHGNPKRITVLSPTLLFNHTRGTALLFARIYIPTVRKDFLYVQVLDHNLMDIKPPKIITVPVAGRLKRGPTDPRFIVIKDSILATFSMSDAKPERMALWNMRSGEISFLIVTGNHPWLVGVQKNWVPFEYGGELHFLVSVDPFRIIRCNLHGQCQLVFQNSPKSFKPAGLHLRGGTPFVHYQGGYFIGMIHSKLLRRPNQHIMLKFQNQAYASHFLVFKFNMKAAPRVVYFSKRLTFPLVGVSRLPIIHFFFPVSIVLEDSDTILVGGHMDDVESMFFRITGLQVMMSRIISLDKKQEKKGNVPPGYLQTLHYENFPKSLLYKHDLSWISSSKAKGRTPIW